MGVSAVDMATTLETLSSWIDERRRVAGTPARFVCVTPAHSLMDCRDDPELAAIFNRAHLVTPDGMAVVWLLRAHGHPGVSRVYGPDLLEAAVAFGVERQWTHFFLGGSEPALGRLVGHLEEQHPGVRVVGAESPPFRPLETTEVDELVARIGDARPDLLWVGLGSPKQERWMAEHLERLDVGAALGVGAAFDFLSGEKAQAPRFVQRSGLEWLFRLMAEPRRLWPRYRRYPLFVALATRDLVRARRLRRRAPAERVDELLSGGRPPDPGCG